jgi:hypothetical protein
LPRPSNVEAGASATTAKVSANADEAKESIAKQDGNAERASDSTAMLMSSSAKNQPTSSSAFSISVASFGWNWWLAKSGSSVTDGVEAVGSSDGPSSSVAAPAGREVQPGGS